MKDIYLMSDSLDKRVGDRLRKFCEPLANLFGMNHFFHYMLTEDGYWASVGTHQEWHESLFSSPDSYLALPQIRDFKSSQERLIFTQAVDNPCWKRIINSAREDFQVHVSLQLLVNTERGQESFGFCLNTQDPLKHMAFMNHLPMIHLFIDQYRKEFRNQFLVDHLLEVASRIGPDFHISDKKSNEAALVPYSNNAQVESFSSFTKRENEVLKCLLEGYITAADIGRKLFISKRTAEHHLETMKQKWDCPSKSELLRIAHKLAASALSKQFL